MACRVSRKVIVTPFLSVTARDVVKESGNKVGCFCVASLVVGHFA